MTHESYTAFAQKVKSEMQELDYEEQLGILTIVVGAIKQKKEEKPKMTKEETMRLFKKFSGSLKVPKDFDYKKEYLEYLDERYGV